MDETRYRMLPHVARPVSRVIFGTARELTDTLLDEVVAEGVTTLDTARKYDGSEAAIGAWMSRRNNRDDLVILSKAAHPDDRGPRVTPEAIRTDLALSLADLRTDRIDLYLLHRDDESMPVGPLVETLNELHGSGAIGAFGGSNWTHRRLAEANAYAAEHGLIGFTVSSPNFGLAEQVEDPWGGGCVTISGPQGAEAREWYRATGIPAIAWSSLGRGLFSGRVRSSEPEAASTVMDEFGMLGYAYPANFRRLARLEELAAAKGVTVPQLALAWVLTAPFETFAVVSAGTGARVRNNVAALDIALTPAEREWLDLGD